MKKLVIGLAAVVVACIVTAPKLLAPSIEESTRAFIEQTSDAENNARLELVSYDRGWFGSEALLNITTSTQKPSIVTTLEGDELNDLESLETGEKVTLQVPVRIAHGPILWGGSHLLGMARFDSEILLPPEIMGVRAETDIPEFDLRWTATLTTNGSIPVELAAPQHKFQSEADGAILDVETEGFEARFVLGEKGSLNPNFPVEIEQRAAKLSGSKDNVKGEATWGGMQVQLFLDEDFIPVPGKTVLVKMAPLDISATTPQGEATSSWEGLDVSLKLGDNFFPDTSTPGHFKVGAMTMTGAANSSGGSGHWDGMELNYAPGEDGRVTGNYVINRFGLDIDPALATGSGLQKMMYAFETLKGTFDGNLYAGAVFIGNGEAEWGGMKMDIISQGQRVELDIGAMTSSQTATVNEKAYTADQQSLSKMEGFSFTYGEGQTYRSGPIEMEMSIRNLSIAALEAYQEFVFEYQWNALSNDDPNEMAPEMLAKLTEVGTGLLASGPAWDIERIDVELEDGNVHYDQKLSFTTPQPLDLQDQLALAKAVDFEANLIFDTPVAELAVLQFAAQQAQMDPATLDEATKRQMIDQTIGFTVAQGFISKEEDGISAHVTMKDGIVVIGSTPVFNAATMLPAMMGAAAAQEPQSSEN